MKNVKLYFENGYIALTKLTLVSFSPVLSRRRFFALTFFMPSVLASHSILSSLEYRSAITGGSDGGLTPYNLKNLIISSF